MEKKKFKSAKDKIEATCLWQPSQNWLNCSVRSRSSACNEWLVVECKASISWARWTQTCASLNCSSLIIIASWAALCWKRKKRHLLKLWQWWRYQSPLQMRHFTDTSGFRSVWGFCLETHHRAGLSQNTCSSSLRLEFHLGCMSHCIRHI